PHRVQQLLLRDEPPMVPSQVAEHREGLGSEGNAERPVPQSLVGGIEAERGEPDILCVAHLGPRERKRCWTRSRHDATARQGAVRRGQAANPYRKLTTSSQMGGGESGLRKGDMGAALPGLP